MTSRRNLSRRATSIVLTKLLVLLIVGCCQGLVSVTKSPFVPKNIEPLEPFLSYGRLVFEDGSFFLSVPRCPRCDEEHSHGWFGEIDDNGIYTTRRSPHCTKRGWDPNNEEEFWQETIITVERTSQLTWCLENNWTCTNTEDTAVEWGDGKWIGSTFMEVWEKDLPYCLKVAQSTQSRLRIPARPSMSRQLKNGAFFKEWLVEKMESVRLSSVYIAEPGDAAGNMVGSSGLVPKRQSNSKFLKNTTYTSNRMQWETETGCRWPSRCCNEDCNSEPMEGAHVFLQGKDKAHIVPMCRSCNHRRIFDYSHGGKYKIKLRPGTWCLEIDHIDRSHGKRRRRGRKVPKEKYARGEVKPRTIDPGKVRRGFTHSEETKAKISASLRKRWATDPEYRAHMVEKTTVTNCKEEIRKKISAILRKKWQDPEFRSEMMSKFASRKRPEGGTHKLSHRKKISAAMKAKWQDKEYRKKTLESIANRKLRTNPASDLSDKDNIGDDPPVASSAARRRYKPRLKPPQKSRRHKAFMTPKEESVDSDTRSDDETILEWGNVWRGFSFKDVWENDQEYCMWVLEQRWICRKSARTPKQKHGLRFKEWIKAKARAESSRA